MALQEKNTHSIQLAPLPEETPEEKLVTKEVFLAIMRAVHARFRGMDFWSSDERSERRQSGMESIDLDEFRKMISADLARKPEELGARAGGTSAFIDRHMGIRPIIIKNQLASIDLTSTTLVQDVLQLADDE